MLGRVLLGSLLAMSVSRCDRGGDGEDAPMPPGCDVEEDPGCEAGDAGVDMGEGGMALDMGGGTSAGTASGGASGGEEPPFSALPPLDVLGAKWTYRLTPVSGGADVEEVCEITEVSTWSDGAIRSREQCGTVSREYAIWDERITVRMVNGQELEPEALLYHVPLEVGDVWQNDFAVGGGSRISEDWTVLGTELLPVNGADDRALKIEVLSTTGGIQSVSYFWWVSGVGRVRAEDALAVRTLVSFTLP